VLVAHACNPSYLGGRDREDCGSKPVPKQIVQETLSQNNNNNNNKNSADAMAQVVERLPEFKL
jgi:hypothetical protein